VRRAGVPGLVLAALLGAAPATGAPEAEPSIPAQAQVATFLHKLDAGDLSAPLRRFRPACAWAIPTRRSQ
jgi:hypothetical protein